MERLRILSGAVQSCFLTGILILMLYCGRRLGNFRYVYQLESELQPVFLTDGKPVVQNWNNILVNKSSSYSETLMKTIELRNTGESSCDLQVTQTAKLVGLPAEIDGKVSFTTDALHQLTLVSYGVNGERRCAGGDYYEVDLHDKDNVLYRSRLPTVDFGNGSYGLELNIPSGFAGTFVVEIWLLFNNWHGMDISCGVYLRKIVVVTQELELVVEDKTEAFPSGTKSEHQAPKDLKRCSDEDFYRTTWQGRWTRSWYNDNCTPDNESRFRSCLPTEHFSCEKEAGWCEGPLGRIESNGWQYSAHCTFKIFELDEAWKCLNGRWFLFWGDSNHQDTIRNLLLFVLEWPLPENTTLAEFQVARSFESVFENPRNPDEKFRVSQIWNSAVDSENDDEGLLTLKNEGHQNAILSHFNDSEQWPDTIIMNSGLHDGRNNVYEFVDLAEFTVDWWTKLYTRIEQGRRPQLLWRTTVAPAGDSRRMDSNPNKMEMFNQVIVEKLQEARDVFPVKFVDAFDLTFPFHYDNRFSDGGHYGRPPGFSHGAPWFGKPHWYFVDLMLDHILLNALCPLVP